MKIIQRGLKKEEIALAKRYMRWYRVIDNEMRLFVNLGFVTDKGELGNKIDYKNNKGILSHRIGGNHWTVITLKRTDLTNSSEINLKKLF